MEEVARGTLNTRVNPSHERAENTADASINVAEKNKRPAVTKGANANVSQVAPPRNPLFEGLLMMWGPKDNSVEFKGRGSNSTSQNRGSRGHDNDLVILEDQGFIASVGVGKFSG